MQSLDILKDYIYGIIPFSEIEGSLLNTKNKKDIPEKAKSLIVLLFSYNLGEEKYKGSNISRYAAPKDYHSVVKSRLDTIIQGLKKDFKDDEFIAFVDNSPFPEKLAAALAGLGVIGKNSLLINKNYGSYFFIGEIVTTADLNAEIFLIRQCINCLACLKACPSRAINEEGGINPELCVSFISQKKGELTEDEKMLMRKVGLVWGCDICQNVCPLNKNIETTNIEEFEETAKFVYNIGDSIEGRAYAWRGEKIMVRNYNIIYNEKDIGKTD